MAYRWSRGDPASPVAGGDRRQRTPAPARRSRCCPAAGVLRREQLRRGHHHPAGLRPARRRVRRRLQRPALPRRRAPRRAPTSRADRGGERGAGRRPRRGRRSSARSRTRHGTAVRWFVAPRTGPQEEATDALVAPTARRRAAAGRERDRSRHQGHRHRRRQHRRLGADGRPAPDLLRRRPRAVVPAADGGVPVAARAAQGGDHEPAVDRRGLRDHGRPVPVGLAQRHHRRRSPAQSSRGCR